jgi:hypothetical protein
MNKRNISMLIFTTPERCIDCAMYTALTLTSSRNGVMSKMDDVFCAATNKGLGFSTYRPEWCPLKDI